jgi:hypothetical protein
MKIVMKQNVKQCLGSSFTPPVLSREMARYTAAEGHGYTEFFVPRGADFFACALKKRKMSGLIIEAISTP